MLTGVLDDAKDKIAVMDAAERGLYRAETLFVVNIVCVNRVSESSIMKSRCLVLVVVAIIIGFDGP